MEKTVYKVTRHTPGDDLSDEPTLFATEEAAMKVARAMAQPNALSSEPGDKITVERVVSEEVAFFERAQ